MTAGRRRRVVLCEPWWRGSHRAWAEGWSIHSRHDVSVVAVEPGSWRWRLRAGAAPLADAVARHVERAGPPETLVVSGLVDVAQLLGLLRGRLPAAVPVVVMQHESQLIHPTPDGSRDDEAALRNWLSWRAADAVWWNSVFHRDEVLAALPGWLRSIPDHDRGGDAERLTADLHRRSTVVHLGVQAPDTAVPTETALPTDTPLATDTPLPVATPPAVASGPPVVLWPHRWEWDKDPDAFAAALRRLVADGVEFRVVLAGEEPTLGVSTRAAVAAELGDRVAAVGPLDADTYRRWLTQSDLVVSCARHEFFGVGVAEAMAHGAWPVVPDALAYPEVVPDLATGGRYRPGHFGTALRRALEHPPTLQQRQALAAAVSQRFAWPRAAETLDAEIDRVVGDLAPPDPA